MRPRKAFNPKRRIAAATQEAEIEHLVKTVRYGGNPEHKGDPGDFGLTPPASPRRDKTLCDAARVFKRSKAEALLKRGIKKGMISDCGPGSFPKNVWSVTDAGVPLEAQLENPTQGTYHGYPMPDNDPFREEVLKRWRS